ncbi:MAG TPA: response regulator [Chthoniobacterales bacterium]
MSRKVIAIVDDLFFASKIRGTAEASGVVVSFPRHADGVREVIQRNSPDLIVCDLHSEKFDLLSMAKVLKSDPTMQNIPLLGFCSHVQTELKREAEEAGFDRVIPRSAFTNNLAAILNGED